MIAEGTRLMLVDEEGRKFPVVAKRGMLEVRRLGVIDGDRLCSSSFGDRMEVGGRRFTVLRPSVRDLLSIIERKAQIISPKDSFLIPLHLDLSSGSRVVEGGVGSGALTLVLLKAVAPEGRVTSYELREDHADVARRNVEMSGLGSCWELRIGDVCTAELPEGVDAVALDMPNPWDALKNAVRSLRPGGHICCYVPNANQLDQSVRAMRDAGLGEVYSFETIQREMVVHEGGVRPSFETLGHTGYLVFGRKL